MQGAIRQMYMFISISVSQWRFVVASLGRPEYVDDSEILWRRFKVQRLPLSSLCFSSSVTMFSFLEQIARIYGVNREKIPLKLGSSVSVWSILSPRRSYTVVNQVKFRWPMISEIILFINFSVPLWHITSFFSQRGRRGQQASSKTPVFLAEFAGKRRLWVLEAGKNIQSTDMIVYDTVGTVAMFFFSFSRIRRWNIHARGVWVIVMPLASQLQL